MAGSGVALEIAGAVLHQLPLPLGRLLQLPLPLGEVGLSGPGEGLLLGHFMPETPGRFSNSAFSPSWFTIQIVTA